MTEERTIQYSAWKFQSMVTCVVYIPCMILIAILVNLVPKFIYDSGIVLDIVEFNTGIGMSISMGLLSWILSFQPDVINTSAAK